MSQRQSYRWLNSLTSYCRIHICLSSGLAITIASIIIFQASIIATVVSQSLHHSAQNLPSITHSLWILFMLFISRGLCTWLREIVNIKSAILIKSKLRNTLLYRLIDQGPIRGSNSKSGAISAALIEHIEAIEGFFTGYLPQMVVVCVLPILILYFVFSTSILAGILLSLSAPLIIIFMALVGIGAKSRSQQQHEELGRMSGHFLDVLRGLATLKLYHQSREQLNRIAKVSNQYQNKVMSVLKIAFLSSAILEFFSSAAIAMLAVYLGLSLLGISPIGHLNGHLSLYSALFTLILAPEFFRPLRELGAHYHARAHALGAAENIIDYMNADLVTSPQDGTTHSLIMPTMDTIKIELRGIDVSYDGILILKNYHLVAHPNEHTVISGPSGVGKSTVLNLISGFIQPEKGKIYINDIDLSTLDKEAWLKHIAWVGQGTRLLHGTIRSNLLIANPAASSDELLKALEIAQLKDLILRLPAGLDTPIGEHNAGLSQGQVQRIALCRAYLKDAPLILLDEATAHLDSLNEKKVLSVLKRISRDKTIISASHRSSTILQADSLKNMELA